ncbi:hypothetical protein MMC13_007910 [Lambiella insularis]|nr:hypothetical protein [Lambiella insularis]
MAMDPTQQKALNALEQYILLSKSATSPRAAADLIAQATSAPNTYVFAELLQTPNIQSLRTAAPEYSPYLTLLEIFSWGTWLDYNSTPNLLRLSEAQSLKLRQLSLLSFSTSRATLTYQHLLSALNLPSVRELEDLVISSIYAGLIEAKLDTLSQRVDVSSVSPLRDLRPKSVPQLVTILEDWDSRCAGVLVAIEGQVRDVRAKAAERRKRDQEHEATFEKALAEDSTKDRGKAAGKRAVGDTENGGEPEAELGESMDVDETFGRGGQRNAKRGGRFGGAFAGLGKRLG